MPLVTRVYIKSALVCFVTALAVGTAVAAHRVSPISPLIAALNPVYLHLLTVGWITQLILGVVYWMFPRYSRERPRGHPAVAWAVYGLLNSGLLLRVVAEPARAVSPAPLWGWLLLLSALCHWLAGATWVASSWPRVRAR